MFLLMLLLSRLAIETALRFILIIVSTHHLTEKRDRSKYQATRPQHSGNTNPMFRLYKCACTNIEFDIAVNIRNKIFCSLIYPIIHFHLAKAKGTATVTVVYYHLISYLSSIFLSFGLVLSHLIPVI